MSIIIAVIVLIALGAVVFIPWLPVPDLFGGTIGKASPWQYFRIWSAVKVQPAAPHAVAFTVPENWKLSIEDRKADEDMKRKEALYFITQNGTSNQIVLYRVASQNVAAKIDWIKKARVEIDTMEPKIDEHCAFGPLKGTCVQSYTATDNLESYTEHFDAVFQIDGGGLYVNAHYPPEDKKSVEDALAVILSSIKIDASKPVVAKNP